MEGGGGASVLMRGHVTVLWGSIWQLLLKSKTMHFANRTIVAGSKDKATGLMVITSGQVVIVCRRYVAAGALGVNHKNWAYVLILGNSTCMERSDLSFLQTLWRRSQSEWGTAINPYFMFLEGGTCIYHFMQLTATYALAEHTVRSEFADYQL